MGLVVGEPGVIGDPADKDLLAVLAGVNAVSGPVAAV